MRVIFSSAVAFLSITACFDVPAPLGHRMVATEPDGGRGGSDSLGGTGGEGGDGGTTSAPRPLCDGPPDRSCASVTEITASGNHTCAAMSDGTIRCWGDNGSHQLGDPDLAQGLFAGPVVVETLRDPAGVALGGEHSCALMPDGVAWCWGRNVLGQLGTGDTVFRKAPERVLDDVAELWANDTTCARTVDGDVLCWGVLLNGQPWAGEDAAWSGAPLSVDIAGAATAIAVASRHACAVLAGGQVVCWGRGVDGRLGNGGFVNSTTPLAVSPTLALPVHEIRANGEQTCVLAGDPKVVQCWGLLPASEPAPVPTTIDALEEGVIDVQVGWRHACALMEDGRVLCWGLNVYNSLGHDNASTPLPTEVGVVNAVQLAVGTLHSCALEGNGTVACWGSNRYGQLAASPSIESSATPREVDLEVQP